MSQQIKLEGVESVKLSDINRNNRIRKVTPRVVEHIKTLAESIKERGLLSPVVLDDDKNLIEGWCRTEAHILLGYETIPVVYKNRLSEADRKLLEIESNAVRLPMTWQEICLGIAATHEANLAKPKKKTEKWTQAMTGALLNVAASHVNDNLKVAQRLRAGDAEIEAAPSLSKAMDILMARKSTQIMEQLAKIGGSTNVVPLNVVVAAKSKPELTMSLVDGIFGESKPVIDVPMGAPTLIDLDKILVKADCRDWFRTADEEFVDIIYTDVPYGIDMELIAEYAGIDSVKDDHDVEENIAQFPDFLKGAFKVLQDDGLLFTFCAWQHFDAMKKIGEEIGFIAQDWPITWAKPHGNKNKAVQYRFAKSEEPVLFLRKPKGVLRKAIAQSHFVCTNPDKQLQSNPFAKPSEFSKWLLSSCAQPGLVMLDPYAGEGSLVRAGILEGMQVIAIERNEKRFPRLIESTKQTFAAMLNSNVVFNHTFK